ncbi:serine/threonine-protein kinase [Serinibacter salmoneus]|uniref:non-specific serine/threonine protein kinase n=1 Tax=Serinibacter salmoneus TaxID=556530 RepID=A0A2A9D405_9MICO|nr:serine/threonine-protein kinase [Serinibacter salmoneus]PFG21121.1 serine/threonine-protein kinase [Serinibacter salmoneus]
MIPARGSVLDGRFELLGRLATGGMGEVWRARDLEGENEVAVKVLRVEFAGQQQFLDRFAAEARNAQGLDHPGIARLHQHGEVDGLAYLAMELVDGEALSDLLRRRGTLTETETLDILQQSADALEIAHRAHVVHRDIKPGNILLTPGGRVRLIDFGISVGAGQQAITAPGMVMGTAQYLPPEQAMGNSATALGDIYALGVVAYECLAGRRPFTGGNQADIALAHVTETIPRLPDEVSDGVAHLITDMLAKDPAQRPATAGIVARRAADLRSRATSAPGHLPRRGGHQRRSDWTANRPRGVREATSRAPSEPQTRPSFVQQPPKTVASRNGVPRRVAIAVALGVVILVALVTVLALALGGLGESGGATNGVELKASIAMTDRDGTIERVG